VARIPRTWLKAMNMIVICGAGAELGMRLRLSNVLQGVSFVCLKSREYNCELLEQKDEMLLEGKSCLLVDVCAETGATLAGSATSVRLYGGKVLGALVLVAVYAKMNGRIIPRLPLGFGVVSCTQEAVDYFTPDQCLTCSRGATKYKQPIIQTQSGESPDVGQEDSVIQPSKSKVDITDRILSGMIG